MSRIRDLIHDQDPYLGFPAKKFAPDLQGWGSRHHLFAQIIGEVRPELIIEVGTWKGASAIHMAELCRQLQLQTEIVCVDTWLGSSNLITRGADPRWRSSLNRRFGYPQLYYTFMRNVIEHDLTETITPFPASSDAAAFALQRHGIKADLIYIDGSHEYESVARDLALFWPLLSPNGVLIGDDWQAAGVRRAAEAFVAEQALHIEVHDKKFVIRRTAPQARHSRLAHLAKATRESAAFSPRRMPLSEMVARIASREPFAFSRWGNGEWNSVFGRTHGHNKSGHAYFPKMGIELRNVLLSRPHYLLGMQNLALRINEGKIESWIAEHGLSDLAWLDADVIYKASVRGQLGPLVDALRAAPSLVLVGPRHLKRLQRFLEFDAFIEVPLPDCYLSLAQTTADLKKLMKRVPDGSVISFSAAMPANLMIDALAKSKHGRRHALIDFGSVWDPYAGVMSRSYMDRLIIDADEDGVVRSL